VGAQRRTWRETIGSSASATSANGSRRSKRLQPFDIRCVGDATPTLPLVAFDSIAATRERVIHDKFSHNLFAVHEFHDNKGADMLLIAPSELDSSLAPHGFSNESGIGSATVPPIPVAAVRVRLKWSAPWEGQPLKTGRSLAIVPALCFEVRPLAKASWGQKSASLR